MNKRYIIKTLENDSFYNHDYMNNDLPMFSKDVKLATKFDSLAEVEDIIMDEFEYSDYITVIEVYAP